MVEANLYDYTIGEILHMIKTRDEEIQIGWACSAQNPDLLPDSYKKKKSSPVGKLKGYFSD